MGVAGGPFLELANMLDATQWMVWGGGMLPFLKRTHTVEICTQWMWWGGADVITVLKLPHSRRWGRSLNLIADMIMVDATQWMVWGGMVTFIELANMVGINVWDRVGWGEVNVP